VTTSPAVGLHASGLYNTSHNEAQKHTIHTIVSLLIQRYKDTKTYTKIHLTMASCLTQKTDCRWLAL
jgi:hypothetical protein